VKREVILPDGISHFSLSSFHFLFRFEATISCSDTKSIANKTIFFE